MTDWYLLIGLMLTLPLGAFLGFVGVLVFIVIRDHLRIRRHVREYRRMIRRSTP